MSGVNFVMYWGSYFFVSFSWFIVIAIGFFIGIAAFDVSALIAPGAIAALVCSCYTRYLLYIIFRERFPTDIECAIQ